MFSEGLAGPKTGTIQAVPFFDAPENINHSFEENEMETKSFLFGLFIGFTIVLAGGSLGREAIQRMDAQRRVALYEKIRIEEQRKAEEKRQQEVFEDKIGLPNFKQRFETLEEQVEILNELPTNKNQLIYRQQKLRHNELQRR